MKKLLLACCLLLLVTGCDEQTDNELNGKTYGILKHNPRAAWFKIKNDNAQLIEAAKMVALTLSQGKTSDFTQIEDAERQVVAGSNYRFVIELTDGKYYYAVVYNDLKNNFIISKLEHLLVKPEVGQEKITEEK